MLVVGSDPLMLSAGGELQMLSEQVEDPAALAGGVVARGSRVAVKLRAEVAGGVNGANEFGAPVGFFAGGNGDPFDHRVELRPVTGDHFVRAGEQRHAELTGGRVVQVLHAIDGALGAEVGIGRAIATMKGDFTGQGFARFAGDLDCHKAGFAAERKIKLRKLVRDNCDIGL